ncbi:MAG TPA: hypothetical protein VI298_09315 [Geobacteraceae bacterium]
MRAIITVLSELIELLQKEQEALTLDSQNLNLELAGLANFAGSECDFIEVCNNLERKVASIERKVERTNKLLSEVLSFLDDEKMSTGKIIPFSRQIK